MNYYNLFFLCLLLFCRSVNADSELIMNGGAEKGHKCWAGFTVSDKDFYSGKYCFDLKLKKNMAIATHWYLLKVDPSKLYTFSMKLKSVGQAPCKVTVAMVVYDKFMRGYHFSSIYARKHTDTQLTAEAKAGDKVIKVANAEKWLKHPGFAVAFYTQKAYADLPNRNLSRMGILSLKKQNGHWDVELKHPLQKTYPAGTGIRLHRQGSYNLVGLYSQTVPNEWKSYSFKYKGVRKLFEIPPKDPVEKFWYGTEYVGIKIIVKDTAGKSELLLDDISLTER